LTGRICDSDNRRKNMKDKILFKEGLVISFVFALLVGCSTSATPALTLMPPTQAELTATPTSDAWTDDFNGALAAGWSWADEDPTHWNLTEVPGMLRIVTQGESLYRAGKPKNLLLRDVPASDFEIITKVTINPQNNFQQAAILMYQDEDNFVLLNRGFCNHCLGTGNGIFLDNEINGKAGVDPGYRTATSLQTAWLKLRKEGTNYIGFYSADGQTWNELGRVENPMRPTKVGITANNSNADPSVPQIPADFDFFTVQGIALPTDASLKAETPMTNTPMTFTSDQLLAKISVGHLPFRLAIGEGAIWVTDQNDSAVYRIDPQTNQVVATIPVGSVPKGLLVGEGAVWVANTGSETISRIDAQTNEVVATIDVGDSPTNVAIGEGSIWVSGGKSEGIVSRIDPATNQVVATIKVEANPAQLAFEDGAVWVASRGSPVVSRIDPKTNQVVARIDVGFPTLALAAHQGAVWVAGDKDPTLLRIDPITNEVLARITVGANPWGMFADTDAIWVASNGDDTLWKIDPQTNQVVATFKVGHGPLGLGVGESALWVVNSFDQSVWRIKP
jgi:virginiamycin B lyase